MRGENTFLVNCVLGSQHSEVVSELRLNTYSPEEEIKEISRYMFIDLVISRKEKC